MSCYYLTNGIVVDGTGGRAFVGDVVVEDDKVVEVRKKGNLRKDESVLEAAAGMREREKEEGLEGKPEGPGQTVEAAGLVISPGFIDIHTHSDLSIFAAPDAWSKIKQGVTTDLVGNCSIGPAPLVTEEAYDYFTDWRRYESRWLRSAGKEWPRWERWSEYGEDLRRLDKAMNIAGLVGHGPLRASVVGPEDEEPTQQQMEEMKALVEEAMQAGAFGISTGLTYTPSRFAETEEVVELVSVVARYDGIYASHIRGEDDRLLGAVEEAIEIGRRCEVPVQISHHKAAGRSNWRLVEDSLEMIRKAREDGVKVAVDVYPYPFGGTYPGSLQRVLLRELRERLGEGGEPEEATIGQIRDWLSEHAGIADDPEGRDLSAPQVAWDEIFVVEYGEENSAGRTVAEVAQAENISCIDWFLAHLRDEETKIKSISMSEKDVQTVLSSPESMVGSDTYAMNDSDVFSSSWLHPRNFGAFARVLEKYVREEGLLEWEEAVHKMTGFPAARLNFSDRGLIKEGMKADLALWAPDKIEEKASVEDPFVYAEGMRWVFVNGKPVIKEGETTGELPGGFIEKK